MTTETQAEWILYLRLAVSQCSSREVVSAIGVMWFFRFYIFSSLRAVLVTAYSRSFRDFGIIGMPRESSTVFLLRH